MPFHSDIEFMSVGMAMATTFAFWYIAGYVLGGDKWAPAMIGMAITGIRGAIAGKDAVGALPDSLGIVSSGESWASMPGYSRGDSTGEGAGGSLGKSIMSAAITFIMWYIAGYFVISGSPWKYATTAAVIAAVGSFVSAY